MEERIFTDINGDELIIKHRASALFFERIADQSNTAMDKVVLSWGIGPTVYGEEKLFYLREEKDRTYQFSNESIHELYNYLIEAANISWKNFAPKEAYSILSDYDSAWSRDHEDEMNLSFHKRNNLVLINVEGPYQIAKTKYALLYKFNKPKLESFLYDIKKYLDSEIGAALTHE